MTNDHTKILTALYLTNDCTKNLTALNARSLLPKMDDLRAECDSQDPDCTCIAESWLHDDKKGYDSEARFLQVICNWRLATDERGLSDEQQHSFYMDLLRFI